jgi:hypothetical protein
VGDSFASSFSALFESVRSIAPNILRRQNQPLRGEDKNCGAEIES